MKNYTSFNSSIQEKELFSYYCALCGALVIVTNASLEKMPLRSSDNAIVIDRKESFCKLYMRKSNSAYIKRKNGLEQQFRWRCECGVLIGYQAISFEESERLAEIKEDSEEIKLKNKAFLYILNDAIVLNMHSSSLIQRLSEYVKTGK